MTECTCDWETGECQSPLGCKAVEDNERLLAALREIVRRYETAEDGWPAEDMRELARRALEASK